MRTRKLIAAVGAVFALSALLAAQAGDRNPPPATVVVSIVATTDLHGYYMPRGGRGGLDVFAAYVNNLRAARAADGGAVLLLDSGDTFQGGVDSNLSEGALVVDAYNAMRYDALAVGNHEFDFGAADRPGAREDPRDDPRGALKARAAQAHFPFLAANLLDEATGRRVDWPNVHASTVVHAAGLRVGIIGVMTAGALRATLPLNVRGLRMAPLTETIRAEAERLRNDGVQLVVVAAHAGGFCYRFDDPADLSSCDATAEIFDVARDLPPGLVNAIVAGHTHSAVAHVVNGIPIVEAFTGGRSFGRIDLTVDTAAARVVRAAPFAPQDICLQEDATTHGCATEDTPPGHVVASRYEGRPVIADERISAAMQPALARVEALRDVRIGVALDTPIPRAGNPESPLGNLFADALRELTGADVALNNNSLGGLREDLPAGLLTFGRLYDTFPFDNRLVGVTVSGETLEAGIANALSRGRRGTFGISGAHVVATCGAGRVDVQLFHLSGEAVGPDERLKIVGMDSFLGGQMFAPAIPPGTVRAPADAPVVRELVEEWLRRHGGHIRADEFADPSRQRLQVVAGTANCAS